jgi:hypothetical protein
MQKVVIDFLPWKWEEPFDLIAQNLFDIPLRCQRKVDLTSHHLLRRKTDIDRIPARIEVREKGTNSLAQGMSARAPIPIPHHLAHLAIHHGNTHKVFAKADEIEPVPREIEPYTPQKIDPAQILNP